MKILIIEDHPLIANAISESLANILPSVNASHATNKSEALDLLDKKPFSFIILDGRLKNNDHGRDVLRLMSDKQLQVTMVHSSEEDFVAECRKKGMPAFLKGGDFIQEAEGVLKEKKLL